MERLVTKESATMVQECSLVAGRMDRPDRMVSTVTQEVVSQPPSPAASLALKPVLNLVANLVHNLSSRITTSR